MFGLPMFAPVAEPVQDVPPQPAESEHYCLSCDLSWWGADPCWICGGPGGGRLLLSPTDRVTWTWANQFRQAPTEGDPPA